MRLRDALARWRRDLFGEAVPEPIELPPDVSGIDARIRRMEALQRRTERAARTKLRVASGDPITDLASGTHRRRRHAE